MRSWSLFALFVVLAGTTLVFGKAYPDLILITGGGLTQPIQITDPDPLKAFNPWGGEFADWEQPAVAEAPCFRRSFEVLFYLKWPERNSPLDRGDLKMIYATRYCSTGLAGYVYLPGPGEPTYRDNIGTIMRDGADGRWHPSKPAWDSLLREAVAIRERHAIPDMIRISGGELRHSVEITDPGQLRKFNPWSGPFVDWTAPARAGNCGAEYEVLYFKRGVEYSSTHDRGNLKMIYGLRYCLDEDGGPGYVHLAGRNDQFGPENLRMVWDGKRAGRWHPSTRSWNEFIQRSVAEQETAKR